MSSVEPARRTDRLQPLLSIVTPAYNEADNVPVLYQRLCAVLEPAEVRWEWIVVDDHSADSTFSAVTGLAADDTRIRGIRLARNFGSHIAIACGLEGAQGDCTAVLASDLQDPPELLPTLLEKWREGADVVWAVRDAAHTGQTPVRRLFGRLYYWIMRRAGVSSMASTGADFFLLDRRIVDVVSEFRESNLSILALITWIGFRQTNVPYAKDNRAHGRSGWSLEKLLKLAIDSVTSFTYAPIRIMSYVGFAVALLGFTYALVVLANGMAGRPPEGWASLMIVVLVIGGIQMLMMGVLGEYVWRALAESRRRPRWIVEAEVGVCQRDVV